MHLPTKRLYFSRRELEIVVPGLDRIVNRFADAKEGRYYFRDPRWTFEHPDVRSVSFDSAMYDKILGVRRYLKFTLNKSSQPRLDCLEIAAVEIALRLVRREKLVCISSSEFEQILRKLEKYRKRARRSAVRALGKGYEQAAQRWRLLLNWMQIHIFHFKPPRWSSPSRILRREQREQTRNLALSMVVPGIDPKRVVHAADLARREVRRGRHPFTLRELLADRENSVQFFRLAVMKHLKVDLNAIKDEFWPEPFVPPTRQAKFEAASRLQAEGSARSQCAATIV